MNKNQNQRTNKKPKQPSRRNRRRRQNRPKIVTTQTVHISECTRDFLKATIAPFSNNLRLPCIPDLTIVPSQKLKAICSGTLSTGTAGVGWIQFSPWMAIAGDRGSSGSSTDVPVVYTGSTFAGTNLQFTVSGGAITTTGVFSTNSNSSLSTLSFSGINTQKRYRLVAAGVQLTYLGSSLRNQGAVYLYRTPGNGPVTQTFLGADLMRDPYTAKINVTRKPCFISFAHSSPDMTYYRPDSDFLVTGGAPGRLGALTILIEGGDTAQPQSWDFKTVSFFEIIGPNLAVSPSESDTTGYGAALSSLPTQAPTTSPSIVLNAVMNTVGNAIKDNASRVIERVVPIAANAAYNYLAGPQVPSIMGVGPTITDL